MKKFLFIFGFVIVLAIITILLTSNEPNYPTPSFEVPDIQTSLRYTPSEFETTTEKMGCVENTLSQKEKLERYLTRDYFAVPGEDTDKTFTDLNADYNSYGFLYRNNTCYGIYVGSYPGATFETIVNQEGDVVLNFVIVFETNDLYDLYIENFDNDILFNIKQKIPNIHSGRNSISYNEYKTILDTLFEGSEVFLLLE